MNTTSAPPTDAVRSATATGIRPLAQKNSTWTVPVFWTMKSMTAMPKNAATPTAVQAPPIRVLAMRTEACLSPRGSTVTEFASTAAAASVPFTSWNGSAMHKPYPQFNTHNKTSFEYSWVPATSIACKAAQMYSLDVSGVKCVTRQHDRLLAETCRQVVDGTLQPGVLTALRNQFSPRPTPESPLLVDRATVTPVDDFADERRRLARSCPGPREHA